MNCIYIIANRNNPKNTPVYEGNKEIAGETRLEVIVNLVNELGIFDLTDTNDSEIREMCEYYDIVPAFVLETLDEYLFILEIE
jgi:hypothetical protein